MIIEHKDERVYATWKLEGRFYQLNITTESGKLQTMFLNGKSEGRTSYAQEHILGGISLDKLEDLNDITAKALSILEREGMTISTADSVGEDESELTQAISELKE